MVQRHIFSMHGDWGGLFFDGAIYRGSLFSGRNAKTGPVGATVHVEGSNSVQRDIFTMREDWPIGPKRPLFQDHKHYFAIPYHVSGPHLMFRNPIPLFRALPNIS